jgi:hypothetical protein
VTCDLFAVYLSGRSSSAHRRGPPRSHPGRSERAARGPCCCCCCCCCLPPSPVATAVAPSVESKPARQHRPREKQPRARTRETTLGRPGPLRESGAPLSGVQGAELELARHHGGGHEDAGALGSAAHGGTARGHPHPVSLSRMTESEYAIFDVFRRFQSDGCLQVGVGAGVPPRRLGRP